MYVAKRKKVTSKIGSHAKENFRNKQIECRGYPYGNGINLPEITSWRCRTIKCFPGKNNDERPPNAGPKEKSETRS